MIPDTDTLPAQCSGVHDMLYLSLFMYSSLSLSLSLSYFIYIHISLSLPLSQSLSISICNLNTWESAVPSLCHSLMFPSASLSLNSCFFRRLVHSPHSLPPSFSATSSAFCFLLLLSAKLFLLLPTQYFGTRLCRLESRIWKEWQVLRTSYVPHIHTCSPYTLLPRRHGE